MYIESPTNIEAAEKGTPKYNELMTKLMKTSYAHQTQEDKKKIRKLMKASTVTVADNVVLAKPD